MTIRAFGRLRTNTGAPLVSATNENAIKTGELVASLAGKLYLGVGPQGGNATQVYVFEPSSSASGIAPTQELGGLIYSDESATSGETYVMLSVPTTLTLTRIAAKTGSGTCTVALKSGSTTYSPSLSATSTIGSLTMPGNELSRRVPQGQPLQLVVSNSNDLTSLIVQVDWLEG